MSNAALVEGRIPMGKLRATLTRSSFLFLIAGTVLALSHPTAQADPAPFERFFGNYEGVFVSSSDEEMSKRDLSVTIKPYKNGFTLHSEAGMYKVSGPSKGKLISISFRPSRRKNIYASAMRSDLFGHAVPANPLKGDPFIWATISGDRLTVYAVRITDSGAQDLQIHKRTLTPKGMDVEIIRFHDEEPIRHITGMLRKVGKVQPTAPKEKGIEFEPRS